MTGSGMASLKEVALKPDRFVGGHRACAGCGFPQAIRMVLYSTDHPVVVGSATGCLEVTSTIYPFTAWKVPFIHVAFENVASTISGVETAYRSLRKQGKIDPGQEIRFVAFGGDGGTYDIGLQALSGAMERGHRMIYVCYDNEAYANTGIQRSSATPPGAATTTTPPGKQSSGKGQFRKDLTAIMAAHEIPYVAQAAISHWNDLITKAKKAFEVDGPAFLNVLAPCRLSWATTPEITVDITRHAVDSCFWPLYEVENGRWRLNYRPKEKKSYIDWMRRQGRFKHLFDGKHDDYLEELQAEVDRRWEKLVARCEGELI